jgi:hypothetical protein
MMAGNQWVRTARPDGLSHPEAQTPVVVQAPGRPILRFCIGDERRCSLWWVEKSAIQLERELPVPCGAGRNRDTIIPNYPGV